MSTSNRRAPPHGSSDSEDGQLVRQQLSGLTRHLRLCSLTEVEIFEVIPSGVLSSEEIGAVCLSIGKKEKPQGLREISNEIVPRKRLNVSMKPDNHRAFASSMDKKYELELTGHQNCSVVSNQEYNFKIRTKQHAIELLPLVCLSRDHDSVNPENCTYRVTISKEANLDDPSISDIESPLTVSFIENVKCEGEFEIPLAISGRNITLLPNSKYTIKIKLNGNHKRYSRTIRCRLQLRPFVNDHLTLHIVPTQTDRQVRTYHFPSTKLQYKVASVG